MRELVKTLPAENYATLKWLARFFFNIQSYIDIAMLSMSFAPLLIRAPDDVEAVRAKYLDTHEISRSFWTMFFLHGLRLMLDRTRTCSSRWRSFGR